jgi:hypothetical protein
MAIRHRSTARRRATATIAFLRAAALPLLSSRSTGPHRRNATLIFLRKRGQGFLLFNQLLGLVKLLSNSSGD